MSKGETCGSKLKEISAKIRNLVAPSIDTNPQRNTIDCTSSPEQPPTGPDSGNEKLLNSPTPYLTANQPKLNGTKQEISESESVQYLVVKESSTCSLPAISAIETDERKSSVNQMNMVKVLNLNKAVDLLRRTPTTRRKRTTYL